MLAATASLARRIETAECRLTVDCAEIIRGRRGDVFVGALNGGAAVYAGPGQPFNKVIGLGFDGLDDEGLTHVERAFAERGAPVQVEIATLADPSIAARERRAVGPVQNTEPPDADRVSARAPPASGNN